jgi:hypothetical protein
MLCKTSTVGIEPGIVLLSTARLQRLDRILVIKVKGEWASRRAENNLGHLIPSERACPVLVAAALGQTIANVHNSLRLTVAANPPQGTGLPAFEEGVIATSHALRSQTD